MVIESLRREVFMDDHEVDLFILLQRYSSDLHLGLIEQQVLKNQDRFGLNQLTPPPSTSEWVKLSRQLFGGFACLLWVGAIFCEVAFIIDLLHSNNPAYDNLYLGCVLALVVLISGIFAYFQESKSSKIMESFKKLVPHHATVMRHGIKMKVNAVNLTRGDIVYIKAGDVVPADVRIIKSRSFKVDNSSLTGESIAQPRSNHCTSKNPLETENLGFYSTNAVEGDAKGIVIRTGDETVMGRIAGLAAGLQTNETPIHIELQHFVKVITTVALGLGVSFFIISMSIGYDLVRAVVFFIGITVANVPEGLLPTVTVCLTLTAQRMANKNCLVKNLEAVETLGSTSCICSDKTGTLTQNRMKVAHFWINDEIYDAETLTTSVGRNQDKLDLRSEGWNALYRCATLCSRTEYIGSADTNDQQISGDASEIALLKMAGRISNEDPMEFRKNNPKVYEVPFSSESKSQISIHTLQSGQVFLVMKGAPEKIFSCCSTILVETGEEQLDGTWKARFESACQDLGGNGERVLGFADLQVDPDQIDFEATNEKLLYPPSGLRFLGLVSMYDPPRPTVPDAVARCRSAGIKVIMVTGDHPITAEAIARNVGIISGTQETADKFASKNEIPLSMLEPSVHKSIVVSGDELRLMRPDQLDKILTFREIVFARTSPQQKLIIVEGVQRAGAIVAVTGDGVNDAAALKKANIGIAMGLAGTEVAKEAADMILLDDNFSTIVTGVEEGRLIFDNLKKVIAYTLTSNLPEIAPFLLYVVMGIPLPLGTVTILLVDLGTDIIPAISLAYETPEQDIMKRNPRNPFTDRLVGGQLISRSYGQIGVMEACAGMSVYFVVYAESGFGFHRILNLRQAWDVKSINDLEDDYGQEWTHCSRKNLERAAQSAFFLSIIIVQWADLIVSKTRKLSIFSHGMRNWHLNIALLFETALGVLLVFTPGMDVFLNTMPIKLLWLLPAFPYVGLMIAFEEAKKLCIRKNPESFIEKNFMW